MYLGEYVSSITAGSRVSIPKKIRESLQDESIILTRGYEECIVLVGASSFNNLLDGVSDQPFILAEKRETARFLLSGAHEVEPDKQGRVVLPESLKKYAHVSGNEVIFIGVGNWVEIWDKARWEMYQEKLAKGSSDIANRLVHLTEDK